MIFKKGNAIVNKKEQKSQQDAKVCYICGKRFIKTHAKEKNHSKVRDCFHYTDK